MTASLCSLWHTLFGLSGPPLVPGTVRNIVLFFKTKSSNHTYLSTNGYLILFCVNTRHPYYSICTVFPWRLWAVLGLTSQTGSFIRPFGLLADGPYLGSPVSGCDLFGQKWVFPCRILFGSTIRNPSWKFGPLKNI